MMLLVTLLSTIVWAQKGKITLGMDYELTNNQSDYYYYYNEYNVTPTLEPNVGYFITDNIVVGLGFKSGANEVIDNRSVSSIGPHIAYKNTYERKYQSISPFVKYYHKNLFASVKYSQVNSSYDDNSETPIWFLDTNGVNTFDGFAYNNYFTEEVKSTFSFNIGYQLAYNDKIYFEPSIGISKSTGKRMRKNMSDPNNIITNNDDDINDLNFGINLSVHLRLGK